ncbi:MAG: ABC transporter ATP-binding protein [Lachnospiraceae bacterium]|nr:ABC transporter ATP-binding protein [Lachnospiraceae bacterium]
MAEENRTRANKGPQGRRRPADLKALRQTGAPKGTFGRIIKYILSHYKIQLAAVVCCILVSALASVIATMFMQRLIDEVIMPGMENGLDSVQSKLVHIILTMAVFYVLGILAGLIKTQTMAVVTQGTLKNLRDDMYTKMETLPIRYFDTHAHGNIMSTYTNDTDAIRQMIGQSLPNLIQASLTAVSIFLMMLYYSIWLTLAVIAVIFGMTKVVGIFGGRSAKYMTRQQKALAAEEGYVEEMLEGLKVVKVFNREPESREGFVERNNQLFEDSESANIAGNVLMPILGNMGNLMYVLIAIIGAVLVTVGATNLSLRGTAPITIGIIVSFLSMSRQLSQTVGQTSMQVSMIAMGIAGAGRVFELIDEQPEQDEGYVTLVNCHVAEDGTITECEEKTGQWAWRHFHKQSDGSVTYRRLEGHVEMEHVDFGYTPEKQVLHDVTLYAEPGQKIAFVGATGAGKTTITNLINRFYDIPDGKIRYDGININKICKPDLRNSLGVVLQEVNLFTGTVMDNIRYGRMDATDEECIAAAKLANADDFIRRLPDGYDTMLTGNGARLSQGQRQLLSIARAAVADPPVMILDEATSSIDTRTEALVQKGMDNLMKGRTVFVIAHRLSTVQNSDCIMVLDHGRIIERGTHDDLIAAKGTYYQLYTGAFELE